MSVKRNLITAVMVATMLAVSATSVYAACQTDGILGGCIPLQQFSDNWFWEYWYNMLNGCGCS